MTASSTQMPSSTGELKASDLNLILQRLEDAQRRDQATSRPYEETREYKVFRGNDKQPTSEVTAQINFAALGMRAYKITQTRGSSIGDKMVREILDAETESAKNPHGSEIDQGNYDFVYIRREDFGIVPEYVLGIIPKQNDKYLLRGQIWVDASTFRIRRIEGIPAKNPSFWIKNIHVTLQYALLKGMWVPVSFDAIATVRLKGPYTLAGLTIQVSDPQTTSKAVLDEISSSNSPPRTQPSALCMRAYSSRKNCAMFLNFSYRPSSNSAVLSFFNSARFSTSTRSRFAAIRA